jgi:hypothetical protein
MLVRSSSSHGHSCVVTIHTLQFTVLLELAASRHPKNGRTDGRLCRRIRRRLIDQSLLQQATI